MSSGWIAFSAQANGAGTTLAFVTAKATVTPPNAYGDLRYGTAMNNPVRDVTIFSRRAIAGAIDPTTGLKPWGILGGQSIQGRYFIVVDASIDNVVQQIQNRNLVAASSVEIVDISYQAANDIHYLFTDNGANIYSAAETNAASAEFSFNSKPYGSYLKSGFREDS